jgi:hypothetical protein
MPTCIHPVKHLLITCLLFLKIIQRPSRILRILKTAPAVMICRTHSAVIADVKWHGIIIIPTAVFTTVTPVTNSVLKFPLHSILILVCNLVWPNLRIPRATVPAVI